VRVAIGDFLAFGKMSSEGHLLTLTGTRLKRLKILIRPMINHQRLPLVVNDLRVPKPLFEVGALGALLAPSAYGFVFFGAGGSGCSRLALRLKHLIVHSLRARFQFITGAR